MRGVLMIEPLYHASVQGLKTQTRRSSGLEEVNGREAVKNKKGEIIKPAIITNPDDWYKGKLYKIQTESGETLFNQFFKNKHNDKSEVCKPRYRLGELLYIKEPWLIKTTFPPISTAEADNEYSTVYKYDNIYDDGRIKWNNKLFMGEDKARAFIKITGIKCERLLDISDEDCIAEGIEKKGTSLISGVEMYRYYYPIKGIGEHTTSSPVDSFLSLYKFANKAKRVPNLWVWAYTFEYLPNYKKP